MSLKYFTLLRALSPYLVGNLGPFHNVDSADTRGKEGLVGIAHGRVGQQHALLLEHPGGDGLGALNEGGKDGRKECIND